MLAPKDPTIFVAGSAHLDVLAQATGDDNVIDKIGHVTIDIGGTACNIATNLAALGLKPRLLTALQENSPYSNIIAAHLRANGVEVRSVDHVGMLAAVFSAHIGVEGEMTSAVSCMPVETATFPESMVREFMQNTRCAILECNLSAKVLNEFTKIANELAIPIFVACVSEEKSLRVTEIQHRISGVFMNRREAAYLGHKLGIADSLPELAQRLACPLIVTCDKDGVLLIEGETQTHIQPIPVADKVHTLGAGDALLAGAVVHHVIQGMTLAASLQNAVAFATGVIGNPNCSAGQGRAIEEALISLERMSSKDPMTGLANRRAGEHHLRLTHDNALHTQTPYAVLMVDIDNFKKVNDEHGHDIGDEAIKVVSNILNHTVRNNDTACRWGGEEFLCILSGADLAAAAIVAERIRATVEKTKIPAVGSVTVSIGIAAWSDTVREAQSLLKTTDQELYEAKRNGRNQVSPSPVPDQASGQVAP